MPHSVRHQTGTQEPQQRDEQLSPPPTAVSENAAQQQPPMLRAWSDELNPKNLTINESLFFSGLAGPAEGVDSGGSQIAGGASL